MSDVLGIFIIALGVVGLGLSAWFVRLLIDGRKQRRKMHQRRVEDAEREAMMAEAWRNVVKKKDDGIDWERRYAELVEVTSARTDQVLDAFAPARGAK